MRFSSNIQRLFYFLIGVAIGYFSYRFISEEDNEAKIIVKRQTKNIQSLDKSIENVKKIRILCFLNTSPKTHSTRAVHIKKTWGKHCDKLLFASSMTDENIGAMGFNVTDNHETMWGKVIQMMQHIHKNDLYEYDWFIKGDDDMFLIPENLRFLLASYSTDDPIYFGHKFNTTDHKRGYFSGGSGYVMSRKTVRTFVEKVLTNEKFFSEQQSDTACHIGSFQHTEDWDITICLDIYNVYAGDARDPVKRERFLPFWPEGHLLAKPDPSNWYWQRKFYWTDEGLDCCSNYTIAFHYIGAKYQYTLYYLTYLLKTYGIKSRFSPPPMKKNFARVAELLDREIHDPSLRGY